MPSSLTSHHKGNTWEGLNRKSAERCSGSMVKATITGQIVKQIIKHLPGFTLLYRALRRHFVGTYTRGHYHSTLLGREEIQSGASNLPRKDVDLGSSIALRGDAQRSLFATLLGYFKEFTWPENRSEEYRFFLDQIYFDYGCSIILYSMLRHLMPKRVIEVGSGFTSALMLDTNERFLQNTTRFTFIEPYPERLLSLLRTNDREVCRVIQQPVQDVSFSIFRELEPHDILFIDSSHVSKFGSDVNHIIFNILPNLRPGVVIHIHDIHWPFEYPQDWLLNDLFFNEAYLVRSFLEFNTHFEIFFFNDYLNYALREFLDEQTHPFPRQLGCSLWLKKVS